MTNPTPAERIVAAREGGFVKRWHAERTLQEDLVGQHSHQMNVLGYLILGDRMTPALAKAVTFHDVAHEKFVGDWPWGAKNPLSRNKARELEHEMAQFFRMKLDLVVELDFEEAYDLAFLDHFDATLYAIEEVRMGNGYMEQKAQDCIDVLLKFPQMEDETIGPLVKEIMMTKPVDNHQWFRELLKI